MGFELDPPKNGCRQFGDWLGLKLGLTLMFLDYQVDGVNFLGGSKPIQESVGGKNKTWWRSHHEFLK